MYDLMLPPCIKGLKLVFLATNQNSWSICNFTVELQAYKKIITKHLSTSSAGVFSVKVIRKNYKMFWDKMSMRKPFLSKATCSSTKTEFLHILFPWKFRKMSRTKTKTFRKIINRACFNEYFYRYVLKLIKLTCRSLSNQSFTKCYEQMHNVKSFGRNFSFCPHLIQ